MWIWGTKLSLTQQEAHLGSTFRSPRWTKRISSSKSWLTSRLDKTLTTPASHCKGWQLHSLTSKIRVSPTGCTLSTRTPITLKVKCKPLSLPSTITLSRCCTRITRAVQRRSTWTSWTTGKKTTTIRSTTTRTNKKTINSRCSMSSYFMRYR